MRILITGAAGFIASHLAERLARDGHEVTGLDCFSDYYDPRVKRRNAEDVCASGARLLELDLATDELSQAVKGAEVVYHLAAQPGISQSTHFDAYLRNNFIATQRLLDACVEHGSLPFFVNIATSSVYGKYATESETTPARPVSHYGVTKLAAEALALSYDAAHNLPGCSLRVYSVYGPRERPEKLFPRLITSMLDGEEFPLYEGAGEHRRTFTYVGDAIDGFVAVLRDLNACRGEIFNVGSEEEVRTLDGIEIVEEILGSPARIRHVPKRPGDQIRTAANIDKIRERLGYEPKTSLKEGLRKTVAWFQAGRTA